MKWITLLFLLQVSSQSPAFELPPDFNATYLIKKYGSTVAKSTLTLQKNDSQISYTSSSKAEGLAAIFTSDTINETSTLKLTDPEHAPYLLEYHYSRKTKPEKNQTIKTTWHENNLASIISHYKNTDTQFSEPHPVWDKLSIQLALINDIKSAKKHDILNYKVVDKNVIKNYKFEYLDDETINVDNHNYHTKKLKRIHASGKRTTIMWLATDLANLPIAIEQHKDNDINWRMELQDINIKAN